MTFFTLEFALNKEICHLVLTLGAILLFQVAMAGWIRNS